MRKIRRLNWVVILTICLMSLGCITIGPTVEREFILVKPGQPIRILTNAVVRGQRLGNNSVARQALGGWVAMPMEHWEAIKKKVKDLTDRLDGFRPE